MGNVAVALGVISTNYIPFNMGFAACSGALILSAILQFSLMDTSMWFANSNAANTESVQILKSVDNNDEIIPFSEYKQSKVCGGDSSLSTVDSTVSSDAAAIIMNHEEIKSNIAPSRNGLRQRNVNITS